MAPSSKPPEIPSAVEIGRRLQHLRENRDKTQEALAAVAGVSVRTYARWEAGESYPSLDEAMRAARELDVTIGHLTLERDVDVVPLRRDRTLYFLSPRLRDAVLAAKTAEDFDAACDIGVCYSVEVDHVEVTQDQYRATLADVERKRIECHARPRAWLGGFLRAFTKG